MKLVKLALILELKNAQVVEEEISFSMDSVWPASKAVIIAMIQIDVIPVTQAVHHAVDPILKIVPHVQYHFIWTQVTTLASHVVPKDKSTLAVLAL